VSLRRPHAAGGRTRGNARRSRGGGLAKRRNRLNRDGFDETHFLSTLDEVIARGTTSAEEMLNAYHTRWDGSIEPVFTEYAY
jgi:gamma-glutamylcysteine synthetase